ncbi:MAG: hypothetical protein LC790_10235 [Actinobacteria bacterium]|nr:hypothetical protein [Actinomycetota bacterium]
MSRLQRDPHVEELVAAYRADLEEAGMFAENEVTSPARSFLLRVGVDGWSAMTLDQQLAIWGHDRRLVAWLIVTGRVRLIPSRPSCSGGPSRRSRRWRASHPSG